MDKTTTAAQLYGMYLRAEKKAHKALLASERATARAAWLHEQFMRAATTARSTELQQYAVNRS